MSNVYSLEAHRSRRKKAHATTTHVPDEEVLATCAQLARLLAERFAEEASIPVGHARADVVRLTELLRLVELASPALLQVTRNVLSRASNPRKRVARKSLGNKLDTKGNVLPRSRKT